MLAAMRTMLRSALAVALLAQAAAIVLEQGGDTLSLDVRAANTPAIAAYKRLGFAFGPNTFPGFLDWDGGFEGSAPVGGVRQHLPAHAQLITR